MAVECSARPWTIRHHRRRRTGIAVLTLAVAVLSLARAGLCAGSADPMQLTLPPVCHAVVGMPMSIYKDNIILTEHPEACQWETSCDVGAEEPQRWTVTPRPGDVGEHDLLITIKGEAGETATGKIVLRVVRADAGKDQSLRLLIIGDSLTAATMYPNELARLLSSPGNPRWTMLGTHRPARASSGVAHEGYGGWTWALFASRYDPKIGHRLDDSGRRRSSPFVYPSESGGPALDIGRYILENCDGRAPDVALILLGINDCFSANPDDASAIDGRIDAMFSQADTFLGSFRRAAPRTVFGIGLTTPPNSRESGFEANYKGKYHRWGWKRIQHQIVRRMIERFGRRQSEGIHLVPTELSVDPVDGYPEDNGVHPNAVGYNQIAASFYCWTKWWMQDGAPPPKR